MYSKNLGQTRSSGKNLLHLNERGSQLGKKRFRDTKTVTGHTADWRLSSYLTLFWEAS